MGVTTWFSLCQEASSDAVRVDEALSGESTQLQGSDASNAATAPEDIAPATKQTGSGTDGLDNIDVHTAAGNLMERAQEASGSGQHAAEHALNTAMDATATSAAGGQFQGKMDDAQLPGAAPQPASNSNMPEAREPSTEQSPSKNVTAVDPPSGEVPPDQPPKQSVLLHTPPNDPRFPVTNQTRYCFVRYNEYHKCVKHRGEEDEECKRIKRAYRSICPDEWTDRWDEYRAEGKWFGKY